MACHRPKPGRDAEPRALVARHVTTLRAEGERPFGHFEPMDGLVT